MILLTSSPPPHLLTSSPPHLLTSSLHQKRCRLMLRLLLEAGGDLSIKEEHPSSGEDDQQGERPDKREGEDDVEDDQAPFRDLNDNLPGNMDDKNRCNSENGHRRNSVIRSSDGWVDDGRVEQVERMIHMAARVGCGGCLALLIEYGAPVNSRVGIVWQRENLLFYLSHCSSIFISLQHSH